MPLKCKSCSQCHTRRRGCAPDPAARLQVYGAALKRIAARTEYGDAVVREVGLKTASDIATEALAWKPR